MSEALRIISWNLENLARWLSPDRPAELAAHVETLGTPDVLCVQEIRVRPQDDELIARMHGVLPGYACRFALCDDSRNVSFRGGRAYGVATFVRSRFAIGPAVTTEWDREGRVVAVTLPARRLTIVNLYAVNGTPKAYVDPATGEPRGDRHEHKRRFQARLFELGARLRERGDVVLVGDWNVSRSALDVTPRLRTAGPHAEARRELNDALARGGWVDVFREHHADARRYTWFGRTRAGAIDAARVDYAVVNAELAPRLTSAQILDDRASRAHSDHAPIAVTVGGT